MPIQHPLPRLSTIASSLLLLAAASISAHADSHKDFSDAFKNGYDTGLKFGFDQRTSEICAAEWNWLSRLADRLEASQIDAWREDYAKRFETGYYAGWKAKDTEDMYWYGYLDGRGSGHRAAEAMHENHPRLFCYKQSIFE